MDRAKEEIMPDQWEKNLACATDCRTCGSKLDNNDQRILSVYTHEPICMNCKREEEKNADYSDQSKAMMSQCLKDTGKPYGDPEGYCFHHFCPYKC